MAAPAFQPDMLVLLHHQHRCYTAQLGQTHQSLSKLYKKLSKIERALAEWKERELTRKDKKKLQWERGSTKSTVRSLELQQACLHDYIAQCDDLIASYSSPGYSTPGGPMSPMAYPFTPWTPGPVEESFPDLAAPAPQYWDLSMLRERQPSSTDASADSGFHEPNMRGTLPGYGESYDPAHVYSHEQISASGMARLSKESSISEKKDVPELVAPVLTGADELPSTHRRRYSENAVQLIESRLGVPKMEVRVGSVPSSLKRAVSADGRAEETEARV